MLKYQESYIQEIPRLYHRQSHNHIELVFFLHFRILPPLIIYQRAYADDKYHMKRSQGKAQPGTKEIHVILHALTRKM